MKFDFSIGNPPYQESTEGTSDKPVYNFFMDEAYKIADKVVLITPAGFYLMLERHQRHGMKKCFMTNI